MTVQEVRQFAKDNSIDAIDIKFCNLFGGMHHITLPVEQLGESLLTNGIGIDGSSVPGYKTNGRSDAILIPDINTAIIDPFWDSNVLSFLGSVYFAGTKEPFPLDPRQVAYRAEKHLENIGIATDSFWGPELEFYIFNSIDYSNDNNHASYIINSDEAHWAGSQPDNPKSVKNPISYQRGYHAAPPRDKYFNLRQRMSSIIQEFGIPVKYHHHEVGRAGQEEIEIEMGPLRQSGDAVFLIKYITKMAAHNAGQIVTYMPKPLYNEAGSGMHFHQHLFKNKKPIFYDKENDEGLSQTALYYIGGILKHGAALLAITNPSTNSYKRLVPGFEAPVKAMFGIGNRSAAVRIPKYATQPNKKRIEFRPPDATTNAYLAMAAQLMAGIDGIQNKIDPVKLGYGPFDVDISQLTEKQRNSIPSLPTTLEGALIALRNDHDFLLKGDVFNERLIDNWISNKEKEIIGLRKRPHPFEMELYFDI